MVGEGGGAGVPGPAVVVGPQATKPMASKQRAVTFRADLEAFMNPMLGSNP